MFKTGYIILFITIFSIDTFALTLEEAYKSSEAKSFFIRSKQDAINIAAQKIRIARSEFYPKLSLNAITKYSKDLNEETVKTSYSGNTLVEIDNTEYSFAAYLSLNYDLYNFGSGVLRYNNSIIDYEQAQIDESLAKYQMKTAILETYITCLKKQYELSTNEKLLKLKQEIYEIALQFYKLGEVSSLEYLNSAVDVAEQNSRFLDTKDELQQSIIKLSGLIYLDINQNATFEVSENFHDNGSVQIDNMPEILFLKNQIKQKQNEYKIILKQRLPSVSLFGNYSVYDTSETSYRDSYRYAKPESAVIGLSVSVPLFEGFKIDASAKATMYEVNKLSNELQQKIHEKKHEIEIIKNSIDNNAEKINSYEKISGLSIESVDIAKMLKANYSLSSIELLQKLIEYETKQLNKNVLKAEQMFYCEKLKLLSQGGYL